MPEVITSSKDNSTVKSNVASIERIIPGSNLKISFFLRKDDEGNIVLQTSLCFSDGKNIPNVPVESFPFGSTSISFENAMKILRERALDYINGRVIFLPESPLSCYRIWEQEILNSSERKKDLKEKISELKKYISILKTNEHSEDVIDAYLALGNNYLDDAQYRDALLCYQRVFNEAKIIQDIEGLRLAHRSLGLVYHKLGENRRAIKHHRKDLTFAKNFFHNELNVGEAYCNLGNIYESCGNCEKAIKYFKKFLKIAENLNPEYIKDAYLYLGHAYAGLGNYSEAEQYYNQSLAISKESGSLSGLGIIYKHRGEYKKAVEYFKDACSRAKNLSEKGEIQANLGITLESLGRYSEAKKCHKEDLQIAKDIGNLESEARAYYNLSVVQLSLDNLEKGLTLLEKVTPLAIKLGDRKLEGMIYGALGTIYFHMMEKEKSFKYHEQHFEVATQLKDLNEQANALVGLGNSHTFFGQHGEALSYYLQALSIVEKAKDIDGQATIYHNLGRVNYLLKNYEISIKNSQHSISLYSDLHKKNCEENLQWQISFFENQFKPYHLLEKTFQETDLVKALLIADFSRARSLVGLLGKKLGLPDQQQLSFDKIQEAAARLQSVIVTYSCDPFDEEKAWCWVISSGKDPFFKNLDLKETSRITPKFKNLSKKQRGLKREELEQPEIRQKGEDLQQAISDWLIDIETDARRGEDDKKENDQEYLLQLKEWYRTYIAPIEVLLPQNGERVTIVLDAFLHDLPFSLFQDPQEKYLFEKCTLITIPSIETFLRVEALDKQNRSQRNFDDICIIAADGGSTKFDLTELKGVKKEGEAVGTFFQKPILASLNIEDIKKSMCQVGHIHLACHGLSDEKADEHSVFEGALVINDHLFYAEDFVQLSLNAELAFLSACESGHGKVYREGTVGLPFALLAGGISSVIATRWKIYDHATQKIVDEFYRHYLGKSEQAKEARNTGKPFGQAEALREAMCFAKSKYPTLPQIWGAFFLMGLPGDIRNNKLREEEENSLLQPVTRIVGENELHFYFDNNKISTKLFKNGRKEGFEDHGFEFQEKSIHVRLFNSKQLNSVGCQKERHVSDLTVDEKKELMLTLTKRKILCNNNKIIICALE